MKRDKQVVVQAFSKQYRQGSKKQKTEILVKLVELTGYSRKHLMDLLKKKPGRVKRIKRHRESSYTSILKPLRFIWACSNYACGQRLQPVIGQYLSALKRHRELVVTVEEKELLMVISSATINRLLKHDRKKLTLKGRSRTKPGSLLKHQIPIRTWSEWDNAEMGFLEIDSVHHCGGSLYGDYLYTLDTVDVATGWNECRAHLGKSEYRTLEALEVIRQRLPFILKGIDFDCGGEFVNYHLIRYAERNQITYTRARAGYKNDQPYIEQQNYSVVRRYVGYQRLDTQEQLQLLNQLYDKLSDYQNFFQPVMRLKTKTRDGAKVTRKYHEPKTAYNRVMARKDLPKEVKLSLKKRHLKSNPKKLLLQITKLGKKISKL